MRVSFKLKLPPTANHRLIPSKGGRLITSPKMRLWKAEAKDFVASQVFEASKRTAIKGDRVAVTIHLTWPDRRKRDIDGPIKPVLDALVAGGAIEDDDLIRELAVFVEDEPDKTAEYPVQIELDY